MAPGGSLRTVSFDGMSDPEAQAARAAVAPSEPDVMWLPVVGLDRHTPLVGLRPLPGPAPARSSQQLIAPGVQDAVYRPISAFHQR